MEVWTRLPASQREARLAVPWDLAEWLGEQDETGTRQLRHILLYLLFPDHFEPLATASQKRIIVRAFAKEFGEDPAAFNYKDRIALDRQIIVIRERLQKKGAPPDFEFYDEPYRKVWQPDSGGDDGGLPSREESEQWYRRSSGRLGCGRSRRVQVRNTGVSSGRRDHRDRVGRTRRSPSVR